jgi:hypothetical protein
MFMDCVHITAATACHKFLSSCCFHACIRSVIVLLQASSSTKYGKGCMAVIVMPLGIEDRCQQAIRQSDNAWQLFQNSK